MNDLLARNPGWQVVVFVCVALVGSPVAFAQEGQMGGQEDMVAVDDEEVDTEAYQRMLDLSVEGRELFDAGQLQEAADTYSRAYEEHPQPILLKNEMIARYLLEECETAVELGQAFVETGEGSSEDVEDAEAVFAECSLDLAEEAVDAEDWIAAENWLDFGQPHWFDDQLRDDGQALRARVEEGVEGSDEPIRDIDEPGMPTRQIAGGAAAAIGAGTLIATGIWHISWERQNRALDEMRADPDADPDEIRATQDELDERFTTVRWAIPTMYALGAVATAAGIGLLVWSPGEPDEGASLQPMWSPDGAGAVLTVPF